MLNNSVLSTMNPGNVKEKECKYKNSAMHSDLVFSVVKGYNKSCHFTSVVIVFQDVDWILDSTQQVWAYFRPEGSPFVLELWDPSCRTRCKMAPSEMSIC